MREARWSVVVPVKRLAEAKTRLRNGTGELVSDQPAPDRLAPDRLAPDRLALDRLAPDRLAQDRLAHARLAHARLAHARLVLAMAQDTVNAVLACQVVVEALVVTDDPEVSKRLGDLGARVVGDQPAAGLNAAVAYGAALSARPHRWVAALGADLPALRPVELAGALAAAVAAGRRSFVVDADGDGTTLLAAPPGVGLDPRFGSDSAARHAASGAQRLAGDWPSLRRDVDTPPDLAAVERLGLGRHTAAAWRAIGAC